MLARLSLNARVPLAAMALAGGLTFGLATPGLAQVQEGDEALIDTLSDPAIAEIAVDEAAGVGSVAADPLPAAIFLRIEFDPGASTGDGTGARMPDLSKFYDGRRYQPIWVGENGANPKARALADLLLAADESGLDPADYDADLVATLIKSRSAPALADLEIRLSKAALDYGRDLVIGRAGGKPHNSDNVAHPKGPEAAELLAGIVKSDDVRAFLHRLSLRGSAVRGLKTALIASKSGSGRDAGADAR